MGAQSFIALLALCAQAGPSAGIAGSSSAVAGKTNLGAGVADPLMEPVADAPEQVGSFGDALRRLKAGSDTLAIAAGRAAAAAAQSRQTLAALLPTIQGGLAAHYDLLHPDAPPPVNGAASASGTGGRPTTPLVMGQVVAQVPLVNLRLLRGRRAAETIAEAEETAFADTNRTLVLALGSTLVSVLAAERAASLQREGLRNALERQFLVERTLELGSGTRLDLVRAQQDTSLARADVVIGREQVVSGRENLGTLLGSSKPVGVNTALATGLSSSLASFCKKVPFPQRPDVLEARLRLRAAEELVDEARAQYFPSLGLQSAASVMTVEPGPFRVPAWTVSAVLDVPIWDGGARGARVAERRFLSQVAAAQARLDGRNAEVEIARTHRGVALARALVDQAQIARDLAREADRMTRRSYEGGDATSFELVQSAQALRQAELILAARQFDLESAGIAAFVAQASCQF
jgi:multidrug efflux system outer membrane protein